jgi:hypothetical protein
VLLYAQDDSIFTDYLTGETFRVQQVIKPKLD